MRVVVWGLGPDPGRVREPYNPHRESPAVVVLAPALGQADWVLEWVEGSVQEFGVKEAA